MCVGGLVGMNSDQVELCAICYIRIHNSLSCFQGHCFTFYLHFYLNLTLTYISSKLLSENFETWLRIFLTHFHSMAFAFRWQNQKIEKAFEQYSLMFK